jgi:hypothetical protein
MEEAEAVGVEEEMEVVVEEGVDARGAKGKV